MSQGWRAVGGSVPFDWTWNRTQDFSPQERCLLPLRQPDNEYITQKLNKNFSRQETVRDEKFLSQTVTFEIDFLESKPRVRLLIDESASQMKAFQSYL